MTMTHQELMVHRNAGSVMDVWITRKSPGVREIYGPWYNCCEWDGIWCIKPTNVHIGLNLCLPAAAKVQTAGGNLVLHDYNFGAYGAHIWTCGGDIRCGKDGFLQDYGADIQLGGGSIRP